MIGRRISNKFLDETVKAKEFLNKSKIALLRCYGFPVDETKKLYTQREMYEICDLIEKLERLEELRLRGFTPKECGELIRMGLYEKLYVCIFNGYKPTEYNALKKSLAKQSVVEETSKEKEPKVVAKQTKINPEKISKMYNSFSEFGSITKDELKLFISMCGYTIDGSLVLKGQKNEKSAEEDAEVEM